MNLKTSVLGKSAQVNRGMRDMTYKRKEIIGDCTLYLGDCMDIMPTLGDVDAVVTDPPYGMSFQSNHRKTKHKKIQNDKTLNFLQWVCGLSAMHSKYIFMRWENIKDVPLAKSCITWVKNNHSMGDLNHEHGRQTEICLFYDGMIHFFPNKRPNDVIKAARTGNELHPTQKPISLMKVVVSWTSGVVVDPFMGSGTTGVACAKMGRSFIGIELDEEYFHIACERIRKAYEQPDMFIEVKKKEHTQEGLL